jgi:deoxyribodipyrimidine photo-lyase
MPLPKMNDKRVMLLQKGKKGSGPVVYWMQRDQRVKDNWAFVHAYNRAVHEGVPLVVIFCLVPNFLEAAIRQYGFMFKGLKQVEKDFKELNIPFYLLAGKPAEEIPEFIGKLKAVELIADFNPLKTARNWKKHVAEKINISFYQVDAHNIVPCWAASDKTEFAAHTLRPKIHKALPEFLDGFPKLKKMKRPDIQFPDFIPAQLIETLKINVDVEEVDWLESGEAAAKKTLQKFISKKLDAYNKMRNDPNAEALSNLSPYLHFGQIAAQRIALEVQKSDASDESKEAYLEELIVRRELADNFCFFNKKYDSFEGFHQWAKKTLNDHRKDKRDYLYSKDDFESAGTHDDLWNAAQTEMAQTGKMHGYMRMYWAKKILEWTKSPEEALETGIYLNDKYELDGRDPNGYAGAAWAIGGVHDRAWAERAVSGKIRYMSYNGCKRKFDVKKYIERIL